MGLSGWESNPRPLAHKPSLLPRHLKKCLSLAECVKAIYACVHYEMYNTAYCEPPGLHYLHTYPTLPLPNLHTYLPTDRPMCDRGISVLQQQFIPGKQRSKLYFTSILFLSKLVKIHCKCSIHIFLSIIQSIYDKHVY